MEIPNDITAIKDLVSLLLTRVTQLEAENVVLKTENQDLRVENEELRRRLGLKSHNSSKPPSSDGLSKKPALSQSRLNKTGGQIGHKGKTLKRVEMPDQIIVHHVKSCPCCWKAFGTGDVETILSKRQVFDIPLPRLEVTEHQVGVISCCGQRHVGSFPVGVNSPVQYGNRIKALSVLLNTDYKVPFDKIEQLFTDLYDCSFNESTAVSANGTCFTALAPVEAAIQTNVLESPSVHFDETGMRVEGKLHWFHTASTRLFTYLFVHPKRGREALNSTASVLKAFKNWAIHDCWASYFEFTNCSHALCNAHLLRELEQLKENHSIWAPLMQALLLEMYQKRGKATQLLENKPFWVAQFGAICQTADELEPPPTPSKRGKPKNTKGRNLLNRLLKHQDGILAFAFEPNIPFTNNQAERDIRCLKIKQKVATSFRTLNGAKEYARIQGFVSTVRKHGMNVFQQILNVLSNNPIVFTSDSG